MNWHSTKEGHSFHVNLFKKSVSPIWEEIKLIETHSVECETCGIRFITYKKDAKYCSKECRGKKRIEVFS